jgi:hypothetical protein
MSVCRGRASSFLLCYVNHHDEAYDWAERRRIEAHPKTGAIQIVEVRERVDEIAPRLPFEFSEKSAATYQAARANFIFQSLSEDVLARIGVPTDWISVNVKLSDTYTCSKSANAAKAVKRS